MVRYDIRLFAFSLGGKRDSDDVCDIHLYIINIVVEV